MAQIVVGVDGSPGGAAALAWAIDEALLRGAAVLAVHAFEAPAPSVGVTPIGPPGPVAEVPPGELEQLRGQAQEGARAVLDAALAAARTAEVEVRGEVREGDPAAALVEASKDAELLVVGSRGHGAFRELLLGSVSHTCARAARCPVVILPAADR